jgi:hypothetical protein
MKTLVQVCCVLFLSDFRYFHFITKVTDVTVISDKDFKGIKGQTLIKSDIKLSGQGNSKLNVLGKFQCAPVSILKLSSLLLIQNFFVQALLNLLSIVPRNPSFYSSSEVTDLTDLLVAQHFGDVDIARTIQETIAQQKE